MSFIQFYNIHVHFAIIFIEQGKGGSAFFEKISIWIRKRNGTSRNIFCIEDNEIFWISIFPKWIG